MKKREPTAVEMLATIFLPALFVWGLFALALGG